MEEITEKKLGPPSMNILQTKLHTSFNHHNKRTHTNAERDRNEDLKLQKNTLQAGEKGVEVKHLTTLSYNGGIEENLRQFSRIVQKKNTFR